MNIEELEINENLLAIKFRKSDWIHLEKPLPVNQDLTLQITGEVVEVIMTPNGDETADRIHVFRGQLAEVVE